MLSQITESVWMIEVGDELHWDDCKKIGTMDEWNEAIQKFNNKHNENYIPDIFTNDNHTVEKMETKKKKRNGKFTVKNQVVCYVRFLNLTLRVKHEQNTIRW